MSLFLLVLVVRRSSMVWSLIPFLLLIVLVDERSAGFFALGIAQQLRLPVVLVCTSGSALLNYYPAIVEAYYSTIPLVIVSADRPSYQIDIGDGQTIRQAAIFNHYIKNSAVLLSDVTHNPLAILKNPHQKLLSPDATPKEIQQKQEKNQDANERQINAILNAAIEKKIPVHLNIPFEEPLYETTTKILKIKSGSPPKIHIPPFQFPKKTYSKAKKLILIGVLPPNTISKEIAKYWEEDPNTVVFTETTSNIRCAHFINSIDTFFAPLEHLSIDKKVFCPDILITLGGMIISKKIKFFFREHPPKMHWHIGLEKANDTFYALTKHIKIAPVIFFKNILSIPLEKGFFHSLFFKIYQKHIRNGKGYLKKIGFSDLKAFEIIFKQLPKSLHLQLSNSSVVRYAQLFNLPKDAEVFCNRGVSGIEGSTSTAIGAAQKNKKTTLLITGDLSFFYDINGLWNNYIPNNFKIILLNNQGGGIFRILPGEKDTPKFDTYFETVHKRRAKDMAKEFGFRYKKVATARQLNKSLPLFFKQNKKPYLLEIITPRTKNDTILLNYFKNM